ncbi:MAG: hypothetical protein KKC55_13770, partial [Gammaproteobacteria bacterium]|nr:hypothetical protein [Gammaproteobacteria bacterium]
IILSWFGIAIIGIKILRYANAELGAIIIFKDGKMSLAGFPINLGLSSIVGISSAVIASKIYLHRKKHD